jgi:hypothetical protein
MISASPEQALPDVVLQQLIERTEAFRCSWKRSPKRCWSLAS